MQPVTMRGDDFSFMNSNNAKVVPRDKKEKRKLITEDVKQGKLTHAQIAKKNEFSEGYVSQINKEIIEWHQQASVLLKIETIRFKTILDTALVHGLLDSCILTFTKDMLRIKDIRDDIGVIADFKKDYFIEYELITERCLVISLCLIGWKNMSGTKEVE